MKIKLSKIHLDFLKKYLIKDCPELFEYLNNNVISWVCEIDEDNAVDIRDWLGEQLQLIGFKNEDELSEEGKVIEELVDIFYSG